jgi:hypothetical protein
MSIASRIREYRRLSRGDSGSDSERDNLRRAKFEALRGEGKKPVSAPLSKEELLARKRGFAQVRRFAGSLPSLSAARSDGMVRKALRGVPRRKESGSPNVLAKDDEYYGVVGSRYL